MKRKMIPLFGFVLALCLALVGCAGAGGGADAAKNFIGTWKLTSMEAEGEIIGEGDIALMESLGMKSSLTLNEDKTAVLTLIGESIDCTWEVTDASKATIKVEGDTADLTLAGDNLTLSSDGNKMMFVKGDASDAAGSGTTSSGGTGDGASAEPSVEAPVSSDADDTMAMDVIIADDDVCTIVVTEMGVDWANDPGYELTITNNSDKTIYVSAKWGTFSVDGRMMDPGLGETIQPGKYTMTFMYFSGSDLGGGVEALVNVEGIIQVTDDSSWDTIATYDVVL